MGKHHVYSTKVAPSPLSYDWDAFVLCDFTLRVHFEGAKTKERPRYTIGATAHGLICTFVTILLCWMDNAARAWNSRIIQLILVSFVLIGEVR